MHITGIVNCAKTISFKIQCITFLDFQRSVIASMDCSSARGHLHRCRRPPREEKTASSAAVQRIHMHGVVSRLCIGRWSVRSSLVNQ